MCLLVCPVHVSNGPSLQGPDKITMAALRHALMGLQQLLVQAGPWVRCSQWLSVPWANKDIDTCFQNVLEHGFRCKFDGSLEKMKVFFSRRFMKSQGNCEDVAYAKFAGAVVEACAAEAIRQVALSEAGWIVFHVGQVGEVGDSQCLVQRCSERCSASMRARRASPVLGDPSLRSFVPKEICPKGGSVILPELGVLGRQDSFLPPESANLEFLRLFGPLKLQHQVLQSVRTECFENAHRVVADVCLKDGCDEWSKYSMPRCQVSLGLPYDPWICTEFLCKLMIALPISRTKATWHGSLL